MTAATARITVARTMKTDIGIRDVHLYLDGKMIATLKHKQVMTHDVAPGRHTLRAYNTLVGKTVEFDVQSGEHVRFMTSNRSGCATSLIFFLGAGPIYISLEREDDDVTTGVASSS